MNWTDEVFNLVPIPEHIMKQIFVPFSEEEKKQIPQLFEKAECKPPRDLLPEHVEPQPQRILKPTPEEIMASALTLRDTADA